MLVEGRLGNSAKFDGTRYIDLGAVGNYNYLDPVSISAWGYPTGKKDGAIVSSMTENPIGSGWGLFLRGGKLWWHMSQRWSDLSMRLETRQDIQLNRWQHVMLTYDGNRKPKGVHVYIDGVEQELNSLFSNLDWPSKSNASLKIGGGGGLDNRFTGLIDEVRLYGQSLSASQARALSVLEPLQEIAAISHDKRSNAQQDKLDLAFLDTASSPNIRQSRQQYEEAQRTLAAYRETLPTVMVMQEGEQKQAYVLNRGRYDAHGEPVQAAVPSALAAGDKDAVGNRLQLARWIASRSNPLTARVIVNRFWQMFFGTGIVKTVDDFGSQGESPSNQPLLDWLAVEFMDSGWDVKHLLKTIMLSRTFRQTSRVSPELQELDPDNRLLARGPRFRLSAGTIRDQALAVAGLLKQQQGGPSVRPYQPPGLWQEVSGETYEPGSGNDLYRRSLYTYWKRTVAPPSMVNFDASDREVCSVYVNRTNTPLQALNLMNDTIFIEAARKFAERLLHDPSQSVPKRIELAYLYAVNRLPHDHETTILANLLQTYQQMYADDLDTAEQFLTIGDSDWDRNLDARELAAYAGMTSLILNLDEVVTKQ